METKPRRRRDQRSEAPNLRVDDERTLHILDLLHPYWNFKYLTMKWLHAFIGGNEDAFKRKLRKLWDAGLVDRPPQQKFSPNSNYKHLVYEITKKGLALLEKKRGIPAPAAVHRSHWYEHEILVDLGFYAPLRYAVMKDPKLKLHTARDLLNGASFTIRTQQGTQRLAVPNPTRFSDDPFLIKLKDGRKVRFDGTPFVLERELSDGSTSFIFVPGIEADRNTEGLKNVKPKDATRTTLTGHLDEIMDFFGERGFLKHYGFNMMMVPIITTNETHTKNAKRHVEDTITACRYMLFKTLPDIAMEPHFPAPSDEYVIQPWSRVGQPPFTFDERGFK